MYGYYGDGGGPGGAGGRAARRCCCPLPWPGPVEVGALLGVGEPLSAREVRRPPQVHGNPLLSSSILSQDWVDGGGGDESDVHTLRGPPQPSLYLYTQQLAKCMVLNILKLINMC